LCDQLESWVHSDWINDLNIPQQGVEKARKFWKSKHFLREEQMKDALTCMGTTQIISCRNYMKITHISKGIAFWTYVDWEIFKM
jgi:hypothetical protein